MEKSYTAEEMGALLEGDVYLILANMGEVDDKIDDVVEVHMRKLKYAMQPITKMLLFYRTLYDVRTEKIMGHWTALALRGIDAYFFDSLGIFPDDQLNKIGEARYVTCSHSERHVGKCLYRLSQRGFRINYNPIQFQEDSPKIATCGRYVILFLNDAIKYTDPYKRMKNLLEPYKQGRYYDSAVLNLV